MTIFFYSVYISQNDDDEHYTNSPDAKNQDEEHLLIEADRVMETQTGFTAVQSRMSAVSEEKYEINQEIAIDDIKCEFVSSLPNRI